MVKRVCIAAIIMFYTISCSNKIELDMQQITTSTTPFIECYCEVGELYNLAATYLTAIDQPQNLDYSYDFEVYITDTEEHRLLQSIFYINNFIYSHGSSASLPTDFTDTLRLRVVDEYGVTYTASSTIPHPVEIDSVKADESGLTVEFDSSNLSEQNYYSLSITMRDSEGAICLSSTTLHNPAVDQRVAIYTPIEESDIHSITISLMRLNLDGYKYLYTIVENEESLNSNLISGVPLNGNIAGAIGVFTAYTRDQITIELDR